MLKYQYTEFNVFPIEGTDQFEAKIFDKYRRVYMKTYPCPSRRDAIDAAHALIKQIRKGFTDPGGIKIDEGRPIREAEDAAYKEKVKAAKVHASIPPGARK